jgi:hypothetical protein
MAMVVQQFLMERQLAFRLQPPYMVELAHYDFWLFPRPKMGLSGHFVTAEDIKCSTTVDLCATSKEAFHESFQAWQNQCSRYVCA